MPNTHTYNNPVKYVDPSGKWLESAIDIASIAYDIYDIKKHGWSWESGLALTADVVSLAVPVFTGGGAIVRAATKVDDVSRAVSKSDEVIDLFRAVDNAELDDIMKMKLFRPDPLGNSMGVKQFWHSADDAFEFIESASRSFDHFYSNNVVKASIPRSVYDALPNCTGFKFFEKHDFIGPVISLKDEALDLFNKNIVGEIIQIK